MILSAYTNPGFINESKAHSRAGAYIFLKENNQEPKLNGSVLTIAQIIKYVMASADEADMAALYITSKNMIPLLNTLIEMVWPQPKTPIQAENSTAVGFTNKTIVNKSTISVDMKLWWLRDRELRDHFRYYWAPGSDNEGDYRKKNDPPPFIMKQIEQTHTWCK